jgi:hypothetical protein
MCRILKSKLKANWADLYQSRPGYIYFEPAYQLLGRYWFTQAGLFSRGRPWAGMRAMPAGPGYPGQATRRLGWSPSNPGWAGHPPSITPGPPGPPALALLSWAPAGPPGDGRCPAREGRPGQAASRLGFPARPCRILAGPTFPPRAGLPLSIPAGLDCFPQAGIPPAGRGRSPGRHWPRPSFLRRPDSFIPAGPPSEHCSGRARLGFPGPGRIIPSQAELSPCGPRFTLFGTYSSSDIDSSTLCQSWDASRLGLAHPTSSYVGLGMPFGSDQHIPPLLVSLILRRRIRLMTWRS